KLNGGTVDSFNDHRIVMAAAIAAAACENETVINCCEAVNKSYPTFFEEYKALGGKVKLN
ncbi:MAG: 3-phosphoshikimate 1-carboxyvinyltransferase, partial [Clostridia bacterium]|nr:3-phosphoshikimate 1-carboxyvinyltransferase [Clostridia bacterium]